MVIFSTFEKYKRKVTQKNEYEYMFEISVHVVIHSSAFKGTISCKQYLGVFTYPTVTLLKIVGYPRLELLVRTVLKLCNRISLFKQAQIECVKRQKNIKSCDTVPLNYAFQTFGKY